MPAQERSNLVEALAVVPDPRRQCRNLRHRLVDVLVIGFCGVLCGCDDFVEIEEFGRAKEDFFRRFLELPDGIPSRDTFRRVFQAVCPQALQQCLIAWLQDSRQAPPAGSAAGEVVAIDGKTLRRTFDRARGWARCTWSAHGRPPAASPWGRSPRTTSPTRSPRSRN